MAYRECRLTAQVLVDPLGARLRIVRELKRASRARHGSGSTLGLAAAKLGVSENTLGRLVARLKVEPPRDRRRLKRGRPGRQKRARKAA